MGKQLKKGRAPPIGKSKKVTKQSAETAANVMTVMEQRSCVHFDKCVDMAKLLKKMKACKQIKCRECKKGVDMERRSEGSVSMFSFTAANKKAIWLCLECGRYLCGGVGLPTESQSHVMRHVKMTCHHLVIQCDDTRLRWCFACQSQVPFEKEENGERKDLLQEAVRLIKERSSNTCFGETEADRDSCSSSISNEIKGSGYGVRGLVNLGNTCFFNSVLQNLLSLDQLRDLLLKEDPCCGGPLVSSLKKLFTEATSQAGLFNSAPQFRGYRQHDSHELLRCLLDGLSIEESSLRKKLDVSVDSDDSEKPTTLVDSVFGGEVSSTISCLECGHSSKVYEPFLDLSLPVPSKKQTFSQEERSKLPPPTKVFKNVEDSKDSSEPVSTMTFDNNQVPEIVVTQNDMEEVDSFWWESFGIEVSHNETDLVSQGGVSDNDDGSAKQKDKEAITQCSKDTASSGIDEAQVWGYPLANEELPLLVVDSQVMNMPYKGDIYYDDKTVAEGKGEKQACPIVRQTFESSTETLEHDMQCSKDTASSGISAEISEAQVWGYPDIGHSFSSAKPCADEEVPLLVADSQVLNMPYKDDKTVAEDKGETSSSYVSGHHDQQTVDYVDFSWFFEEPDVSCDDDKTVREREDEVSSSLMSSHHGKTVDYVDLNEPGVSCNAKTIKEREGEVSSSLASSHHGQTVDYVDSSGCFDKADVSCNDKTVRKCEGEAPSSFLSSHHGQTIYNVDLNEPDVSCNDKTVKEREGEVSSSLVSSIHHGQTVDYVDSSSILYKPDVSCNDKTVKECEASSSFVSGHHEQKIENADYYWYSDEPEISKGPCFGPPTKAEVSEAGFSSNSDANVVLDDSDSPVSVESCLALFTKHEILSEDNAWHCENCSNNLKLQRLREKRERFGYGWMNDYMFNQSFIFINCETIYDDDEAVDSKEVIVRSAATKRVLVNKAPPVLTIHLKRFSQDARGRLSKLRGHVAFNEFIDLGLYMDMDSRLTEEDHPVYMLSGLVEHSGTMRRGHYRIDSSVWYRASDSFVRQVSFEEVLRSEAYILFYKRI
ncbi:hypothetical protein Bca52824_000970 [Brassica carinata]|uniref:ubiquitinyl hydrolase 1 n=1 Tax=Brassica carinata TaxID=52824 RepID=A0A8X7WJ54_BRACI|nr:hypothetical protein Bca52824_000970 [Brassica carinata]